MQCNFWLPQSADSLGSRVQAPSSLHLQVGERHPTRSPGLRPVPLFAGVRAPRRDALNFALRVADVGRRALGHSSPVDDVRREIECSAWYRKGVQHTSDGSRNCQTQQATHPEADRRTVAVACTAGPCLSSTPTGSSTNQASPANAEGCPPPHAQAQRQTTDPPNHPSTHTQKAEENSSVQLTMRPNRAQAQQTLKIDSPAQAHSP